MEQTGTTVFLNANDLIWLEQIVMDKDKAEALKFVERLKKEVTEKQKAHCKPRF